MSTMMFLDVNHRVLTKIGSSTATRVQARIENSYIDTGKVK